MGLQYLLFQIVVATLSHSISYRTGSLDTWPSSRPLFLPPAMAYGQPLSFSSLWLSILSGTGPMEPLQPKSKARLLGKAQLGDHG